MSWSLVLKEELFCFLFFELCASFHQEADTVGIFTLHKCFSVESEDKQLFACPMQLLWINI